MQLNDPDLLRHQAYIDGQWCDAPDGAYAKECNIHSETATLAVKQTSTNPWMPLRCERCTGGVFACVSLSGSKRRLIKPAACVKIELLRRRARQGRTLVSYVLEGFEHLIRSCGPLTGAYRPGLAENSPLDCFPGAAALLKGKAN